MQLPVDCQDGLGRVVVFQGLGLKVQDLKVWGFRVQGLRRLRASGQVGRHGLHCDAVTLIGPWIPPYQAPAGRPLVGTVFRVLGPRTEELLV